MDGPTIEQSPWKTSIEINLLRQIESEPRNDWFQAFLRRAAVLDALRSLIERAAGDPQARLPPERELARTLGVSRRVLRRELASLEAEGRIWRHVGQGTFVGGRPPVDGRKLGLLPKALSPADVMEARRLIEPGLAALAAVRATVGEVERLENCLHKADAAADVETFETWDSLLHQTIAQASRNSLLLSIFQLVNSGRENQVWGQIKKRALTQARRKKHSNQHKEIVRAIRERDAARAQRLMMQHLDDVTRDLFSRPGRSLDH